MSNDSPGTHCNFFGMFKHLKVGFLGILGSRISKGKTERLREQSLWILSIFQWHVRRTLEAFKNFMINGG